MKTVYLIFYLWHNSYHGGPAITFTVMPSLSACEIAGRAAADLVIAEDHLDRPRYRCVEVPK